MKSKQIHMKTFKLNNEQKIATGFIVPENYFEDFQAKMLTKIPVQESKVISIFARRKTWIYSAAAVLVMSLSIPVYQHIMNQYRVNDSMSLENYIAYHTSVSGADMAYLLDEEDIQNINIDYNIEDEMLENELSRSNNIEHYLLK